MLRDLALFAHSVFHAKAVRPARYYWDHSPAEQLDHVVELLSNTEDPERQEIRRIYQQLRPRHVLDGGCGPATELGGYKRHGLNFRYIGLDGSERMLATARQRHPDGTFVRGSLERLPLGAGSCDLVLLKHVLEHLPTYETAIAEAVRVAGRGVVINLFHRLIPLARDIHLQDRRGFWNNWYSRPKFERFLQSQPIRSVERIKTTGTAGQTAEIFILHK